MPIEPRDHAESVALFRHSLIGFLATQTITRGQLIAELRRISEQRHRLPDNDSTRSFSVPTLQRWVYALRRGGIEALRPAPRSDRGRGQRLTPELRELLCDIRREHRDVSVSLILTNLRSQGRIGPEIKPATVRRMLADKGLTRAKLEERAGPRTRLRWQAERPGLLWHGDVCHGPTLKLDGKSVSMRIHALLDDASRYVVGLRVVSDEREAAMLRLLASAVKEHGMPQTLYLDNGSTYRGQSLSLFCARLGGALMHARPYDPQARGKMERFWGTMRGQVLDHIGQPKSLLEVEEKLWIWLRKYYLVSPHAGLLGQTPEHVYDSYRAALAPLSQEKIDQALQLELTRRVRNDCTLDVSGVTYEVPLGFLAGQKVTLHNGLLGHGAMLLEWQGKKIALHPVDTVRNGRRSRQKLGEPAPAPRATDFSPLAHLSAAADTTTQEEGNSDETLFLS